MILSSEGKKETKKSKVERNCSVHSKKRVELDIEQKNNRKLLQFPNGIFNYVQVWINKDQVEKRLKRVE